MIVYVCVCGGEGEGSAVISLLPGETNCISVWQGIRLDSHFTLLATEDLVDACSVCVCVCV